MKKLCILFLSFFSLIPVAAQVKWAVDPVHSKLGFSITHLMISEAEGKFKVYEGKVSSKSETDFSNANILFSVEASSINTENEQRDQHLKSADFFDVEKYPKIKFQSTSLKLVKGTTYTLEGDLTLHGITKKVVLTAVGASKVIKDPLGNYKYAFNVTGVVNRKDFGLVFNIPLEGGGVALSEEVKLDITIQLVKQ